MNGGRLGGTQALSASQVSRLSTPYVDVQDVFAGRYGYGLMISEDRGVRVVDHGGVHIGFTCQVKMIPERRFAVIALANGGASLPRVVESALELGLGLKPKKPVREAPQAVGREDLERAIGRYGVPPESVEIQARGGRLLLKLGDQELPMTRLGADRFSILPPDAAEPFAFRLIAGPDGAARYFAAGFHKLKRIPSVE
jgi:hypothetical protein